MSFFDKHVEHVFIFTLSKYCFQISMLSTFSFSENQSLFKSQKTVNSLKKSTLMDSINYKMYHSYFTCPTGAIKFIIACSFTDNVNFVSYCLLENHQQVFL